ncbi:MAG: hypothetical protein ACI906_000447 [Candidatus Latescibacterota bacterium]|jgi:uncharacterized protein (DUF362 family)
MYWTMKKTWLPVLILALVAIDLSTVAEVDSKRAQVLPTVDKEMLGEAQVAIACSHCIEAAAARDEVISYEQVDAIVKRAIRLDDSARNLAAVVEPGDWVAIKVNIVTAPLVINGRKRTAFWDSGKAHWGQATDLRVVKSVLDYLVNEEGQARRITIVEGGAEWSKVGESGTDPNQTEDGWTVHWEEFDNLSYAELVETFNGVNGIEVDIVDLNYDDWVGTEGVRAGDPLPVPDPNHSGISWYQRPEGYFVSKTLLDVDKLVNIAPMKTHDIPGVTLLHKQYVGTYMQRAYGSNDNSKMGLHRHSGNEMVPWGFIDLFSYRPTDYGILEGFWGTEGRGPQWGENVNHNVVIVGGDPVAVDAVGATVMGYNPEDLAYLRLSAAKGFGTFDMNHIDIKGDAIAEIQRNFKKTPKPDFWGWGNRRWLVNGPYAVSDIDAATAVEGVSIAPVGGSAVDAIIWREAISTERFVTLPDDYVASSSATYAFAYIKSERDQEGTLYLGASDGAKVWLNGEEVGSWNRTAKTPDAVAAPVALRAGYNPVLVKVYNIFGAAGLSLVAGDEDGDTLPGISYHLARPAEPTAVEENQATPNAFALGANYPNPFNAGTAIPYVTSAPGSVELNIYDVRGALVRQLVSRSLPGGPHLTHWDGRDEAGRSVGSGLYVYRLVAEGKVQTAKMALLK